MAKHIGCNYLWIDSLCIVQDDERDWQVEAGLMAEVYKHANCNIGATGATDGRDGLFFDRNPELVDLSVVYPTWPETSGKPYIYCSPDSIRDDFSNSPLVSRAWVLQERVLAPRTIHFGRRQLYWECREQFACETLPAYLPERMGHSTQEKEDTGTFFKTWDPKKLKYWNRIVET